MIIDKSMSYGVLLILLGGLWAQSDYEEYLKKDQQAFTEYETSITAEYEKYALEDKQAFEKYKPNIFLCSIVQYISGLRIDLDFLKKFPK